MSRAVVPLEAKNTGRARFGSSRPTPIERWARPFRRADNPPSSFGAREGDIRAVSKKTRSLISVSSSLREEGGRSPRRHALLPEPAPPIVQEITMHAHRPFLAGLHIAAFLSLALSASAQLTDVTQTPNTLGVGIQKSLIDEIGAGRGDMMTPGSSEFLINR